MSFTRLRPIKATRKPHRCYWCWEQIPKGSPAIYYSGVWDGDLCTGHYHPECNEANDAWWVLFRNSEDESPERGSMKRGSTEPKQEQ